MKMATAVALLLAGSCTFALDRYASSIAPVDELQPAPVEIYSPPVLIESSSRIVP